MKGAKGRLRPKDRPQQFMQPREGQVGFSLYAGRG
jgi:hypothetical protein